jgi:CRISPR-associated protein Cmr2
MDCAKMEFEEELLEIITPNSSKSSKTRSIPNRFLAEVSTNNNEILKEKAATVEEKVKAEFQKVPGIKELPIGAIDQLKAHLEINWLFHKIENSLNVTYKDAFMEINSNLAAMKNYTPFTGLSERGRKCIVDGRLNVKFYRETRANEIRNKKGSDILNKLYQEKSEVAILNTDSKRLPIWQLQKGEGISAVTLRKRLYENEPHAFPSTAAVALMHIFEECEKEGFENKNDFKEFKINVQGEGKQENSFKTPPNWLKHSDDQLFFKDNIERILKKERRSDLKTEITEAHEKWSKKLKTPFTPYYALIRFDGDKMGDWFSGNHMIGDDLMEFQKTLSAAIIDFANSIQSEMNKYWGKVVYAGGEDFMAFVNLHKLRETVECVNKIFDEKINRNEDLKNMIKIGTSATLSMGICIAHYKEPLQMVLDKTAAAEKLAKDSGRNSFAISVSKHSGGQTNMVIPWNLKEEETCVDLWANFNEILKSIIDKTISAAFLRNIYDYLETYQFSEGTKEFLDSKIKLFVGRAKMPNVESKKIELLIKNLKSLHQSTIPNFAETLLVLDFLQRKAYE